MIKLKDYPTPFAGVSLGVIGIFAFWGQIYIGAIIAAALLLPVIIKFILHPNLLLEDIKHPTVGSVVPTIAMSSMLVSKALHAVSPILALSLWSIAVTAHLTFFSVFIYHRFREWHINHIVPSWFVPPVGIVVACLSVPSITLLPLAHALLYFGIITYAIMLPTVMYRLALGDKIENTRKPTIAILAAPASLSLAGYLTLATTPNIMLLMILFSIAALMTTSVYIMLFHMLTLSFSPAFAALTFPLAISATAMMKMSIWAKTQPLFQGYAMYFHTTAILEGIIGSLVIGYVLLHTVTHIFHKLRKVEHSNQYATQKA